MSQANLYISKRCPYCRKLLEILYGRQDLRGMISITCIDEQPFPKYVKSVPVMVVENELWSADEIFAFLQQDEGGNNQQQQQHQPQHQQQQQQQQQPQQTKEQMKAEGELDGYCENGSCLAFAPLNEGDTIPDSPYSSINNMDEKMGEVRTDPHVGKNEKSAQFDNDYEKMMNDRKMIDTNNVAGAVR